MNNYKLHIQYDGTDYAGWQIQNNAPTVQQEIIDAIEIILKERVNLIGSGRTDAGVHALGQIANFRCETELDIYKFNHSLNSIISKNISVTKIENVPESFHSRFDAKRRTYLYLISKIKSPFLTKYSYDYSGANKINLTRLNELSSTLLGTHDFTSFSRKNSETENKICTINSIHWRDTGNMIQFMVEADRYLHGMVRTMVGTLLKAERKNLDENYLLQILNDKARESADEAAPAKGLFLFKVRY